MRLTLKLLFIGLTLAVIAFLIRVVPHFIDTRTVKSPRVRLAGRVLDDATGAPSPRARVVIEVWHPTYLGGASHRFALEANDHGYFSLDVTRPNPITSIEAAAASRDGGYERREIVGDRVEFRVRPWPAGRPKPYWAEYELFSGLGRQRVEASDFEFIGTYWETRTAEEIAIGMPPRPNPLTPSASQ